MEVDVAHQEAAYVPQGDESCDLVVAIENWGGLLGTTAHGPPPCNQTASAHSICSSVEGLICRGEGLTGRLLVP